MKDFSELLETADDNDPCVVTITGDAGVGKTRLAATWPNPLFIRAEDGFKVFRDMPENERPKGLPVLKSTEDLREQLTWVLKGEHDFKTLVVDSVTQLDTMFGEHVITGDDTAPDSLARACGGYGAGYKAVGALHGTLRQTCELIKNRRGMHIVFIAHSDINKMDLPDEDPYSRYQLRLHKDSVSHYVDNVDMVAYVRLETFLRGDKKAKLKKALSDGTRIAICHSGPAQVSKNRFGIEEPVVLTKDVNPFPFIK